MGNKNVVVWDLICYVVFPLVIWHATREYVSDYYAMLISSVPGIIYSIVRFILIKKLNVFGIFMIANLVIGTLIDVLSGSAMNMLWNNVYYLYILAFLFLLTALINKPLYLYFSLDFVEMQGHNRKKMKELFYQKRILTVFKWITIIMSFRDIVLATIKVWFIKEYGVEAFEKGIILRQIIGWIFAGLMILGLLYITKLLNTQYGTPKNNENKEIL